MSDIVWQPSGERIEQANVTRFMRRHGIATYEELVRRSNGDVAWFWRAALDDLGLEWYEPYHTVLDDSAGFPFTRWFLGGTTNVVLNCVDRHVRDGRGGDAAVLWEGDDGATATLTYAALDRELGRAAAALVALGVGRGDAVGLYLPMVPEVVVSMLACLKVGAVPVPVFSGFGPEALAVRLNDARAVLLITAAGGYRRGKVVEIKRAADVAAAQVGSLRHVLVVARTGLEVPMTAGRDLVWSEALAAAESRPAVATARLEAEATALILYTSGTTGRPKGTVHTHAGCLAQMTKELAYYMDVKQGDRFFWFTDIGWMMGPWEIIGVLSLGATFLIYEGTPNWPKGDRLWEMIERFGLTHLGISPTAVRLLIREGDAMVERHPMDTLRILGSTGETWDPESWTWFFEKVGKKRCPIINISGGTEIVGCLLAPLPITPLKPATLGGPGLGMDVDVFDEEGKPIRGGVGHLVCKKPAPSMTKGFLNDRERYLETYFSRWPGVWYHGDWARVDADGFWFLHGRADDTIKVAGKRVGPGEVEAALIEHAAVSEAAAIGIPHALKGEVVACFVVLNPGAVGDEALRAALKAKVVDVLGKSLAPEVIKFVAALPKTRSAKIVRGAIRRAYLGEAPGDVSSVENPDALAAIARGV
jgi:acetyl-CoA synthetase